MARSEALTLVLTCLGIALGFMVVEIINKYVMLFLRHRSGGNLAISDR